MNDQILVRLLGPIDVTVNGAARSVPGLRRKALLTMLALHLGQVVSAERLTEVMWGGDAPVTSRNSLQRHLSYLRRNPGLHDNILAQQPGYLLKVGDADTDVRQAESLVKESQLARDPRTRADKLTAALRFWRGRPLADLFHLEWFVAQAELLEQMRLAVCKSLNDAGLSLGDHVSLVPRIEDLITEEPFDEELHRQLMVALYRSGRQADALAVFERLQRRLSQELGVFPGTQIEDLRILILRQDPTLMLFSRSVEVTSRGVLPVQLPQAIAGFVGRDNELSLLDSLAQPGEWAAMPICAISGTAGVGKSVLAVHWAHRVTHRFPDGQLYVNLRGFDGGGAAVEPSEAVRGFLGALGVPPAAVPATEDAQVNMYRSLTAGKRILVVLDNARDAEQVRPLLPGAPTCLAVVTSRTQLTPLLVTEGAQPLSLDVLTPAQAQALLTARVGPDRLAAEADTVQEIVSRCAGLPLALALVAARIANEPTLSFADLATALRSEVGALDAFNDGDDRTDLRGVFSWSFHSLSAEAAVLFGLIGLHPGPDFGTEAAASLIGLPLGRTRVLLAELTRAHLLTHHSYGRYWLHGLLRAYAIELAQTLPDRDLAIHRLLDHYLHTAFAASRLHTPLRPPIALEPPARGVTAQQHAGRTGALDWFANEHPVLSAMVPWAFAQGFHTHAWQLAWAMTTFLGRRGYWDQLAAIHLIALDAAGRLGDPSAQGDALRGSAFAGRARGQHAEADQARQAAYAILDELAHPRAAEARAKLSQPVR